MDGFDTGKLYAGKQMLKSYPLPAGKTPLFIGGSGVTLEAIKEQNRICVYPVANSASVVLTLPHSEQDVHVYVRGLGQDTPWASISVKTPSGKLVASRREGQGI